MIYVIEFVLGVLFGAILGKCGLGEYHRVVNQFRLKDWTIMKFMLTAITVGSVLTVGAWQMGLSDPEVTMPEGVVVAALVGGAILGVGMAVAGMCPGTIVAGVGRGSLDYLVPGVLGLLFGGIVVGIAFEPLVLPLYNLFDLGTFNIGQLLGVNPWVIVGAFVVADVAFYAVMRRVKL